MEKVTLSMPGELKRQARAKAILEGKNLSEVVREALRAYLEDGRPELQTKEAAKP